MLRTLIVTVAALVLLAAAVLLAAGRAGMLRGTRPADLGLRGDGMLKPPGNGRRNVVSSYALRQPHDEINVIAPIRIDGDPAAAFARLQEIVRRMPRAKVIVSTPDYLHAEFETPVLRFVDDAEFVLDAPHGVIQMRSASRIGRSDFGVNRARLERIRDAMNGGRVRER